MIDPNLLKVIFWTFSFNMMVPHSLKVPLVELSFFDTGLYKLGSMRYMAEKTSTNVYRSVWVYLCISILFCIFHFQLKVDFFIINQYSATSAIRATTHPRWRSRLLLFSERKLFQVAMLLSTFLLLLLLLFFVFVLFHVELHSASPLPSFRSHGGLPAPSPSCHQLWQSRGIFPEYSSPSKYLEVHMHFARILFPITILMSSSPVVFCRNTFVKNCIITRIMSE